MRKKANGTGARLAELEHWTFTELLAARTKIEQLLLDRRREEAAALRQRVNSLVKGSGFSVKELMGKVGGRGWKSSATPKYRDPKNPANTWSGRGRPPRWIQGRRNRDEFLIR